MSQNILPKNRHMSQNCNLFLIIFIILPNQFSGAKEFGNPGPLYTKPKAHDEDGEMAEDEQRKPK